MMSEYYDHYHRWEPLAEFHFFFDDDEEFYDDNYVYCLCSRAVIRDGVRTYYAEKEYGTESEAEIAADSQSQDIDDHSHVHFSVDTSYKTKCEKDEGASCYCSASHTDNYCSTDELDPTQIHGFPSHALQPSDSGADLTYQDCHSDYTTLDKIERMEQDIIDTNENYLSDNTWEKFWASNGERIIWASWIKKYSDYINPTYLDENNDLVLDDNNIPKQHSAEPLCNKDVVDYRERDDVNVMRERKFSYDSKVNPYKKASKDQNYEDKYDKPSEKVSDKDEMWLPARRRRSCSEHDGIVSPRTLPGTDSMTNVTKLTLSSHNVTSSHVTSESTPTDDYSVSSSTSTSDDQFNDQTRIVNIDDTEQMPSEDLDTEQYWQFLWKKHFGEQYALHYANYIECHEIRNREIAALNVQESKIEELKGLDNECENSEGNSQELPSVIEVQTQIDKINLEEKVVKPKRRTKNASNRIISSVGVLLQNLLKEQKDKSIDEAFDGEDGTTNNEKSESLALEKNENTTGSNNLQNNSNVSKHDYYDGDDDPPEEKPVSLKRSHEIDDEEVNSEKVKSTFQIMGFSFDSEKIPKGQLIYRKRLGRLRPPRYKRNGTSKKTYFDDEGKPYHLEQNQESQDEGEMLTDDDGPEIQSDGEKNNLENKLEESTNTETENTENHESKDNEIEIETISENTADILQEDVEPQSDVINSKNDEQTDTHVEITSLNKRRRRPKRYPRMEDYDTTDMPVELKGDEKMFKYWKKRHSLFHRFDEGIQLDRESWFSVTPESVARHIADKCGRDHVVDAFCGAGGNTIQFALTCKKVTAIDIDPAKIEMAKHNAAVYGVADRIEFIVGDFFEIAPTLTADMVFLSPPWGGPNYSDNYEYDIETMLEPKPASELMRIARDINSNIALYLPRNTRMDQILSIAQEVGGSVEVEQSYLDKRFIALTAYFY
ncbi:trimethylguanosine synthase [Vanessa cardui]|uniref:trimethylguanosine synthase n=1 Tax=Vanessa cardui TaxID=171605 RepID=UPI001F1452E7|nr:trimethylguanosine synthase [Vanessa cardui]